MPKVLSAPFFPDTMYVYSTAITSELKIFNGVNFLIAINSLTCKHVY